MKPKLAEGKPTVRLWSFGRRKEMQSTTILRHQTWSS